MKKYLNTAFVYAILAMVGGVFYREFTKFAGFSGKTMLSVVHTHYFILGMLTFLLLVLFEKCFGLGGRKMRTALIVYETGLNLTVILFVVRGILQVLGTALSSGANAAISGIAGTGHIILAAGIIMLMLQIKKAVKES